MKEYVITAKGCDDATLALVTLTDEQAATARMLAAAINARSDSVCKPSLDITPRSEADPDDIEAATEPTERH
ncbi:hypothetical protein AXA44_02760 [Rhodococcus sp. SC4]|nr:hypothetical protein AXA44_02760 [Rhodococcus sp. SC4]